jgi:hypothetical protein
VQEEKKYLILPENSVLKKNFNRTMIIIPIFSNNFVHLSTTKNKNFENLFGQRTYEVVIQNNEAYLSPYIVAFDEVEKKEKENSVDGSLLDGFEIVDYAASWKHSLLLLSEAK